MLNTESKLKLKNINLNKLKAFFYHFNSITLLQTACSFITNPLVEDDVEAFASYIRFAMNNNPIYFDYYEQVEEYIKIEWEDPANLYGIRPTYYTYCNEIGSFRSSEEGQMFGNRFPIDIYVQSCRDIFGETFTAESIQNGIDRTNLVYGGLNPGVQNIIYTHGAFDPLRLNGVTESQGPLTHVTVMPRKTLLDSNFKDLIQELTEFYF